MSSLTNTVLAMIAEERERQDVLWGEQNHRSGDYYLILSEEVGEVAEAVVHLTFGGTLKLKDGTILKTTAEIEKHYLTELVQMTAVGTAMIECILRRKIRDKDVTRVTGGGDAL